MNTRSTHKNILILLLPILAGVSWGTSGIFVRTLSSYGMNSKTMLFGRALPAMVILLLILLFTDRSLLKVRIKDLWLFIVSGLIGMFGLNICYNITIVQLSLSLAAVLLALSPVFVVLLAAFVFHEKFTRRKVICMILAIFGAILVSGLLENGSDWSVSGLLIGFLSAFFYALYTILSKIAMNRGYNGITTTFYSLLFLVIILLPITSYDVIGSYLANAPARNSLFLLLNSLLISILPYLLFTFAIKRAEAGIVSILAAAGEPAAATVFGILLFHEMPTVLTLSGLVLTIIALALLLQTPKEK